MTPNHTAGCVSGDETPTDRSDPSDHGGRRSADGDATPSEELAYRLDFDGTADDAAVVFSLRDDGDGELVVELRLEPLECLPWQDDLVLSRSRDAFGIGTVSPAGRLCVSKSRFYR